MKVRCKFVCVEKETRGAGINLMLHAVVGGSEENDEFFALTPTGQINLHVVNPKAAERFEVDKEYFVDFSEA